MKTPVPSLALSCVLALTFAMGCSVSYDFQSPAAAALDGITEGTLTVDGVPLVVQAGTMTAAGVFTWGGSNATLYVVSYDGLGMVSSIAGSPQIQADTSVASVHDGVVFLFGPMFTPQQITLSKFFTGEDCRIFADDVLYGDFEGNESGDVVIALPTGASKIGLTALGVESPLGASDDSDYFVTLLQGTMP